MAGGWARDDAVNEQIEISTQEAIARARQRVGGSAGDIPSAEFCAECEEPIPPARREAIPGVQLCVACQTGRDKSRRPTGGVNRRASKDALLK